jgi:hypothetical protein
MSGPPDPSTLKSLGDYLNALANPNSVSFLSEFHYIENNKTKK